jgi:hypothetical protein
MRITSVELHPAGSANVAVLSFRDPTRSNSYNVRSITGLDADEIVARYYGGSGSSAKFYDLALEKRQPIFRVQLNPNYGDHETHSSLRDDLYRMIASSRTGKLSIHFKNGVDVVAAISGFVIKLESPLFEREPEVHITLDADDPMLRALVPTELDVEGLNPDETVITDNLSTAHHGLKFELSFAEAEASVNIHDPNDDTWAFEVTPDGGFLVGDVLHFSSEKNDKYLYIQRGANQIHVADKITAGSVWPILFPGVNTLKIDGVTVVGAGYNVNWDAISHRPSYWGV